MENNNLEKLKKNLHELIDSIENIERLQALDAAILDYMISTMHEETTEDEDDFEDDLTEEQVKELDEAIAEVDRGETISIEEFKERMEKWTSDLKKKYE